MLGAVAIASVLILALAVLFWTSWRNRRIDSQKLASALIGEIAAVLETIDVQQLVTALDRDVADPNAGFAPRKVLLPRFTIYEANATKLDRLSPPLQQKIAFLFSRWAALSNEVEFLGDFASPGERGTSVRRVLDEVQQSLRLADEILLALRSIATPRSKARHLN